MPLTSVYLPDFPTVSGPVDQVWQMRTSVEENEVNRKSVTGGAEIL